MFYLECWVWTLTGSPYPITRSSHDLKSSSWRIRPTPQLLYVLDSAIADVGDGFRAGYHEGMRALVPNPYFVSPHRFTRVPSPTRKSNTGDAPVATKLDYPGQMTFNDLSVFYRIWSRLRLKSWMEMLTNTFRHSTRLGYIIQLAWVTSCINSLGIYHVSNCWGYISCINSLGIYPVSTRLGKKYEFELKYICINSLRDISCINSLGIYPVSTPFGIYPVSTR